MGLSWEISLVVLPLGDYFHMGVRGMRKSSRSGEGLIEQIRHLRSRLGGLKHDSLQKSPIEQERNLLRSLIDNLPYHIYVKDTKSRFTACNMMVAQAVGAATPDEVLGKTDFDFLPLERAQRYYDEEQAIMRSGQAMINREDRSVDGAGNKLWGITTKVPLRDGDGKIVGLVGIGHDITRHKQADEALRQERNLLRTLIDNLPDHIYVKDTESRFIIANNTVVHFMGLKTMDEIIGKTDFDFHRLEMAEQYYADEQMIIKSGQPLLNRQEPIIDRAGDKRWLSTTKVPLQDGSGKITGLVGIGRDITEQKRAQEKLLDYQEQLKSLASRLSLGEERERRRIAMQLHDRIAQSLVISKLKLEALLRSGLSADVADILTEVCSSLDTAIQDTKSLTFDLSCPVLYELGFEMAVAGWLVENIQEKHGIKTEFHDDGKPKPLDDDVSALLFRDVRELLINVVKHARAHKVKVSVFRVDNRMCVTVEDDGVGFDPDEIVSVPARKCGFGLFSIRERLSQSGEVFKVNSKAGCGTKVTITASLKARAVKKGAKK